jgi:hypothetical protein
MATDPNARMISLGFPGGSLTANRGLLTALFGPDLIAVQETQQISVGRQAHSRVRVIGGDSTNVRSTTYVRKRYPSASAQAAQGGEPISLFYNGDWWTARLSGSHQDFNDWLKSSTWGTGTAALWRSEKGTKYGPFVPPAPLLTPGA